MNDDQYLEHNKALLADFTRSFISRTRELPQDHPLRSHAESWLALTESDADLYAQAPELAARLFDTFPEFAPTFPRLLLWFLGGDCLHYMADEEITRFQALDELRVDAAERGEILDIVAAQAQMLKPH